MSLREAVRNVIDITLGQVISIRNVASILGFNPPISVRNLIKRANTAAWHDLTVQEHRQMLQRYYAKGFRTISLCVYGEHDNPRYAAVMIKRQQPVTQIQFNSLDFDRMQQVFNDMAAQGLGPMIITATGPPDNPLFAVVFQPVQPIPFTRFGITEADMRQINENMIEDLNPMNRHILQWADSYGTAADVRYIGIWFPSPNLVPWNCDALNDADDIAQKRFNALTSVWCRPLHVALTPSLRFLELYVDNEDGRWDYKVGMTSSEHQTEFNNHMAQGLAPTRVAAKGTGPNARFATIYAEAEEAQPRHFRTTGSPSIPAIDNAIEDIMRKTQTRGAALAIVKGTKLVYAKGYTWAEEDYPTIQPTTFFRQASVSKVFAALATYQLVMEERLDIDKTKMQDILQLRTPSGQQPTDPNFNNITIRHLLEYKSGLDPDLLGRNVEATQAFNAQLPATPIQLACLVASKPLAVTVGELPPKNIVHGVANTSYFMLSQVIAKLRVPNLFEAGNPNAFEMAITPTLLQPFGITRVTRVRGARTLLNHQLADEARYHKYRLETGRNPIDREGSVVSPDRRIIPVGYGEDNLENFDGAGGLSAAVTDVARILACLNLRERNPILDENTLFTWFNNAAGATSTAPTPDGLIPNAHGFDTGVFINGMFHAVKGGLLSTSSNGVNFTDGGISYVICWNWQGHGERDTDGDRLYNSTGAENWYPEFRSLLNAARNPQVLREWDNIDLFPQYGMNPL